MGQIDLSVCNDADCTAPQGLFASPSTPVVFTTVSVNGQNGAILISLNATTDGAHYRALVSTGSHVQRIQAPSVSHPISNTPPSSSEVKVSWPAPEWRVPTSSRPQPLGPTDDIRYTIRVFPTATIPATAIPNSACGVEELQASVTSTVQVNNELTATIGSLAEDTDYTVTLVAEVMRSGSVEQSAAYQTSTFRTTSDDHGSGAKIGIIVACIVLALVVLLGVPMYVLWRRNRRLERQLQYEMEDVRNVATVTTTAPASRTVRVCVRGGGEGAAVDAGRACSFPPLPTRVPPLAGGASRGDQPGPAGRVFRLAGAANLRVPPVVVAVEGRTGGAGVGQFDNPQSLHPEHGGRCGDAGDAVTTALVCDLIHLHAPCALPVACPRTAMQGNHSRGAILGFVTFVALIGIQQLVSQQSSDDAVVPTSFAGAVEASEEPAPAPKARRLTASGAPLCATFEEAWPVRKYAALGWKKHKWLRGIQIPGFHGEPMLGFYTGLLRWLQRRGWQETVSIGEAPLLFAQFKVADRVPWFTMQPNNQPIFVTSFPVRSVFSHDRGCVLYEKQSLYQCLVDASAAEGDDSGIADFFPRTFIYDPSRPATLNQFYAMYDDVVNTDKRYSSQIGRAHV